MPDKMTEILCPSHLPPIDVPLRLTKDTLMLPSLVESYLPNSYQPPVSGQIAQTQSPHATLPPLTDLVKSCKIPVGTAN